MAGLYDELLVLLHGIWSRRWIALAVAWGVCMLGWLGVSLIPNGYESKARVYVNTQSLLEDKIGITQVQSQQDLDRVRQTLLSAENLEKVVRGTDLAQTISGPRDVAGKITTLREHITVLAQADPSMIDISATSADSGLSDGANARIAQQVVQKLIDIFQEENLTGGRTETRQSLAFLDQQIAGRGKQLEAADKRRVEFAQRYAGVLPGAGTISQRMDAARLEINNIDAQLVQAQSALSAMNGQLAGTPATLPGVAVGGGASPLAQAQAELAGMRARGWTASHPDVIAAQRQVDNLRRQGGASGAAQAFQHERKEPLRTATGAGDHQTPAAAAPVRGCPNALRQAQRALGSPTSAADAPRRGWASSRASRGRRPRPSRSPKITTLSGKINASIPRRKRRRTRRSPYRSRSRSPSPSYQSWTWRR